MNDWAQQNPIVRIGDRKYNRSTVIAIAVPEGVTGIARDTFYQCHNLSSISLPNSLTSIEGSAFNSCTSLVSINIPPSVIRVQQCAFYQCSSLSTVNVSPSTEIASGAFAGCTTLINLAGSQKDHKVVNYVRQTNL